MPRRTSRTRDGFSIWLVAAWKRRLKASRFSSLSCSTSWSSVLVLRSSICGILRVLEERFAQSGDHFGLDRQLLRRALESDLGDVAGNAVELEQDPAGLHPGDPEFGRALARAHADLGGLRRDRHVREDPDPQAPLALDVTRDRAAGRLDLARGDPLRLQRLQAVGAEVQLRAALGVAVNSALVGLAELGALRLQHGLFLVPGFSGPGGRRRFEPPSSAGPGSSDRGRESRP